MAQYSLRKVTIGGGGSGSVDYPWDLTVSEDGGITDVTILPGTINHIVPSNMFQTISTATADTLFVKLQCNTDGKVITNVVIQINNIPAIPQIPTNSILPSYFEYTVGVISGNIGYNIARKFLTATGSRLFLTDKDPPAQPGEMAFEEYLVWSIV